MTYCLLPVWHNSDIISSQSAFGAEQQCHGELITHPQYGVDVLLA